MKNSMMMPAALPCPSAENKAARPVFQCRAFRNTPFFASAVQSMSPTAHTASPIVTPSTAAPRMSVGKWT